MPSRRHFHTFDALRFLAFFLVFLTHVPIQHPVLGYLGHSGGIGVSFFFVLSGFLITYIILHEKVETGQFSGRRFLMRRILRIWPLYYAMIAFAFVSPYLIQWLGLNASAEGYEPVWWMSCLFLENYKMMFTGELPNVSPLSVMWSLCIEEHFYLLWGLAFYWIPLQKIPWWIAGAILVANLSRGVYFSLGWSFGDVLTHLDYFAYGAIPAYCLFFKKSWIDQVGRWSRGQALGWGILTLVYVFAAPHLQFPGQAFLDPFFFGVLFMVVLFLTLPSPARLHISDQALWSRLGIYTYGLYLYHTIVINLLKRVYNLLEWPMDTWLGSSSFFGLALLFSIGVSILSYWLFERPFLRLKKYFR